MAARARSWPALCRSGMALRMLCESLPEEPSRGAVVFRAERDNVSLPPRRRTIDCLGVDVPPPSPRFRGRLAELLEQAVEQALEGACAPPAGIDASMSRDASLSDQLFRARAVGFRSLEVSVGSLERLALSAGAMDPRDTDALVFWIAATRDRPVTIVLDAGTSSLPAYGPTVELGEILLPELVAPRASDRPSDAPVSSTPAPPIATVSALPPALVANSVDADEPAAATHLAAMVPLADIPLVPRPFFPPPPRPQRVAPAEEPAEARSEGIVAPLERVVDREENPPAPQEAPVEAADAPEEPAPTKPVGRGKRPRSGLVHLPPKPSAGESPLSASIAELAIDEATTPPPPSVTIRRRTPEKRELDAHAELLQSSRGPRPLAQVERMFVERYVPLSDAELHGEADDFQRAARHEWSGSFAKSYAEAWSSLRVSGKRPQMVMDAPAIAARTGRLHGARAIELFLVDGMRYDLGCMVHERLRVLIAGLASCADRSVLWSALPSSTATQMDSLARGPEALMGHGLPDDDSVVVRGRAVSTPRRVRIGNRDLVKLDLVEARLRELGPPLPERFASLADEIATVVARHIESLPPRTLVFVFGDHGFLIDGTRKSSGPARQGGSSPDEVLVPAFGWLTGGAG